MNHPNTQSLLRRTAAGLSAVAAIFIAAPAAAQGTVSLSTGGSCTYSGMSIAPNGNVVVTCQSATPGAPGSIVLNAPSSLTAGTSGSASVNRPGGSTGATNVNINVSGGCTISATSVAFADGDQAAKPFTVTAPASAGSCTVAISASGAASLGSPSSATITITAVNTNPQPGPGNCPAAPADMTSTVIENGGLNFLALGPSKIGSAPLPRTKATWSSGQIKLSETSSSPDPVVTHISISKCPGVIDTANVACYVRGGKNLTDLTWMERPSSGINNANIAAALGVCWAPASEGPWYVNVRYDYTACLNSRCAFNFQWGDGGIP
jgi:hypothetical protein